MRTSSHGLGKFSLSWRASISGRINTFLRARYPANTAENVAADTGVKPDAVRKWLNCSSAPSVAAFFSLVSAYGPEFLAAVAPQRLGWLDDAAQAAADAKIKAQIAALQAQLERRA